MTATLPWLLIKTWPRDAVISVPRPARFPPRRLGGGMRCPQRLISQECRLIIRLIIQTIQRDPSGSV
jgi:hypothetical protein